MKRLLKKILILMLVTGAVLLMFSFRKPQSERILSELICSRTDALNRYYCGLISYNEAAMIIKETEKGRLMEEDITCLREYFQTDIEEITSYDIKEIDITYEDEDLVCAVVTIEWNTDGTSGKEITEEIYSAIMEKSEKSFKLVQFF